MAGPSEEAAEAVLSALSARPPTLLAGRLLSIDGPSGAGKTTLAAAVAARVPGAVVVHVDELVPGWDGLPEVEARLAELVRPLAVGEPGSAARYDWVAGAASGELTVSPGPLLVLDGVGAGSTAIADLVTLLVWVEADPVVRRARGVARDGAAYEPWWEQWAEAERAHFAAHRTRERAELVVAT